MNPIVSRRLAFCVVGAAGVGSFFPSVAAQPSAVDPAAGRAAYQQYCARCHGETGKGDGRDSKRHYPRPRDFTSGIYKFRTTATGTAPKDEDLFSTITNGLPGSGMPDWRHLDEATRWQLVYYLKTLASSFQDTPPELVNVGNDPGPKRADVAKGRQVYEKLGCAACHGAQGRANGASAPTLMDGWGAKIRPADLTYGWNYHGGAEPRAILVRMLAGIDGTPMPSYAEAVSPDDAWQLAYYVRSLQQEPRWGAVARAGRVSGRVPDSPDDPAWMSAQQTDLRLRPAVDAGGSITAPATVTAASLRVLINRDTIGFRLSWHDPSEDREGAPDAVVVALRPEGLSGDAVTLQTWPMIPGSPALDLCGWSANRPQNGEAVTDRFEAVLSGAAPAVALGGQAAYHDGVWSAVLTRPLRQPQLAEGAVVEPGRLLPVALAIWDGGNPGLRAISMWFDVALEQETAPRRTNASAYLVWLAAAAAVVVGIGLAFRKP